MKVTLAKSAGFCFGVKRAVDKVYEVLQEKNDTNEKTYTYGPIIHNEEVVRDLEEKGVIVIHSEEELKNIKGGTVVIRSHGVSRHVYDILEERGVHIVDATCPFVKKIHKIVEKETEKGHAVIIIGNPTHPEVEGIEGWGGKQVFVVNTEEDAKNINLKKESKVTIVAQTTFNFNKFDKLVEIISEKGYDINVVNTICNATNDRQAEARKIAREVDAMIVIGGRHSSNTQKLYEICKEECDNTYYIQTLVDLDTRQLQSNSSIGITAGASTPKNIIEEVRFNVNRI